MKNRNNKKLRSPHLSFFRSKSKKIEGGLVARTSKLGLLLLYCTPMIGWSVFLFPEQTRKLLRAPFSTEAIEVYLSSFISSVTAVLFFKILVEVDKHLVMPISGSFLLVFLIAVSSKLGVKKVFLATLYMIGIACVYTSFEVFGHLSLVTMTALFLISDTRRENKVGPANA